MDFEPEEFWCELVINGIGGRTIEKAKQRISPKEFEIWKAFRIKRGSFFTGRRIEQAFGNFSATYFASKGAKDVDALAFMPHEDQPKEEVLSVDDAMEKGLGKLT